MTGDDDFQKANLVVAQFIQDGDDARLTADVVKTAWTYPPCPTEHHNEEGWAKVFTSTRIKSFLDVRIDSDFPLTIYRGTVPDRLYRMPWTTDPERARRFACGCLVENDLAYVYRTEVNTAAEVLMDMDMLPKWTNGRSGENEVVLATATLKGLEIRQAVELRATTLEDVPPPLGA